MVGKKKKHIFATRFGKENSSEAENETVVSDKNEFFDSIIFDNSKSIRIIGLIINLVNTLSNFQLGTS